MSLGWACVEDFAEEYYTSRDHLLDKILFQFSIRLLIYKSVDFLLEALHCINLRERISKMFIFYAIYGLWIAFTLILIPLLRSLCNGMS